MSDVIEAAARALQDCGQWDSYYSEQMAEAVLAAVTPLIRAAALERAAQRIEANDEDYMMRNEVAAKIRTLKEQP